MVPVTLHHEIAGSLQFLQGLGKGSAAFDVAILHKPIISWRQIITIRAEEGSKQQADANGNGLKPNVSRKLIKPVISVLPEQYGGGVCGFIHALLIVHLFTAVYIN